jgi:very-short-patch-repair endonuclease
MVDGIPGMTPAETMFDLARREAGRVLRGSVEEAVIAKAVTIGQLEETCGRRFAEKCPSVRPMARILDDLALGEPVPESELERLLDRLLNHPDIPRVTRQAALPWRPKANRRVDALIDPWWLIIEVDGLRWHARFEAMERDRARDNEATAHGYRVLRFTYWMLRDHPAEALELILRVGRLAA